MFLANKIGGSRGGEGKSPFGYELACRESGRKESNHMYRSRTGLLKIDVQRRYVAFGVF